MVMDMISHGPRNGTARMPDNQGFSLAITKSLGS